MNALYTVDEECTAVQQQQEQEQQGQSYGNDSTPDCTPDIKLVRHMRDAVNTESKTDEAHASRGITHVGMGCAGAGAAIKSDPLPARDHGGTPAASRSWMCATARAPLLFTGSNESVASRESASSDSLLASLRSMVEVNVTQEAELHRVLCTPARSARHATLMPPPHAAPLITATFPGSGMSKPLTPQSRVGLQTSSSAARGPGAGKLHVRPPRSRTSDEFSTTAALLTAPRVHARTTIYACSSAALQQQRNIAAPLFPRVAHPERSPVQPSAINLSSDVAHSKVSPSLRSTGATTAVDSTVVIAASSRTPGGMISTPGSSPRSQHARAATSRKPVLSATTSSAPSPYSYALQPLIKPTMHSTAVGTAHRPQTQPQSGHGSSLHQRNASRARAVKRLPHADSESTPPHIATRCADETRCSIPDRLLQLSLLLELSSPLAQPLSRKSKLHRYNSEHAASKALAAALPPSPELPSSVSVPHTASSSPSSTCGTDLQIGADGSTATNTLPLDASRSSSEALLSTANGTQGTIRPISGCGDRSTNSQAASVVQAPLALRVSESQAACSIDARTETMKAASSDEHTSSTPCEAQTSTQSECVEYVSSMHQSPEQVREAAQPLTSQQLADEFDELIPEDVSEDGGDLSPISELISAAERQAFAPHSLSPLPAVTRASAYKLSRRTSFSDTFYSDDFALDANS